MSPYVVHFGCGFFGFRPVKSNRGDLQYVSKVILALSTRYELLYTSRSFLSQMIFGFFFGFYKV